MRHYCWNKSELKKNRENKQFVLNVHNLTILK